MTRKGPAKPVDKDFALGRLNVARGYLKAARDMAKQAGDRDIGNPIVALAVLSAIAYADAVTAMRAARINQKDHRAAVKTLRDALGSGLPAAESKRLARILNEKDNAQYGSRATKKETALNRLDDLEAFAAWAEAELEDEV
jgi:hypothetical protein